MIFGEAPLPRAPHLPRDHQPRPRVRWDGRYRPIIGRITSEKTSMRAFWTTDGSSALAGPSLAVNDGCKCWLIILPGYVVLAGVVVVAGLTVFVVTATPMHCQGPIARPPFRGCRHVVYGLFGRCRNHGVQPARRVMAILGGQQLLLRRVCLGCGLPSVFCRAGDTGRPFLGCSGFPACRKQRWLAG
jgi:hypothetical protein